MLELAIGTRFYYKGGLCEVLSDRECIHCMDCVSDNDTTSCQPFACSREERKDKTEVFFERVEESVKEGI